MGLQKGNTNNPAGRPAGTPNKISTELKEAFAVFLQNNIDDLQANYDKLEPKDKLYFFDKFAKLILPPPLKQVDYNLYPQANLIDKLFPPTEEIIEGVD